MAWIVKHLNARVLGTVVGGLVSLAGATTFSKAMGHDPGLNAIVYVTIPASWTTVLSVAIADLRHEQDSILEARRPSNPPAQKNLLDLPIQNHLLRGEQ